MKTCVFILIISSFLALEISCRNEGTSRQQLLEHKDSLTMSNPVDKENVFLDTAQVLKMSLEKVLEKYKPITDFQYDLDKANWGGDDRILLRNHFTEQEISPKETPAHPIVIREIFWRPKVDHFIIYWYQKKGSSWGYICNSEIYPDGTEF